MPGPCSLPAGNKSRWEELNEIVCDKHFKCNMSPKQEHDFITYREWLLRRNRLTTTRAA